MRASSEALSDESAERELFARRARALVAAERVPSLEAVLRLADAAPAAPVRERSGALGRVLGGMMLAAACAMAAVRVLAHGDGPPVSIARDADSGAPARSAARVDGVDEMSTCDQNQTYASVAEERACVAAPMSFVLPAGSLSCEQHEVNCSVAP